MDGEDHMRRHVTVCIGAASLSKRVRTLEESIEATDKASTGWRG